MSYIAFSSLLNEPSSNDFLQIVSHIFLKENRWSYPSLKDLIKRHICFQHSLQLALATLKLVTGLLDIVKLYDKAYLKK